MFLSSLSLTLVDCSSAGSSELSVRISCKEDILNEKIETIKNGIHVVSFTAQRPGVHSAYIYLDGIALPGTVILMSL